MEPSTLNVTDMMIEKTANKQHATMPHSSSDSNPARSVALEESFAPSLYFKQAATNVVQKRAPRPEQYAKRRNHIGESLLTCCHHLVEHNKLT